MTSPARVLFVIESWSDLVVTKLRSSITKVAPSSELFLVCESSTVGDAARGLFAQLGCDVKCIYVKEFAKDVLLESEIALKSKIERCHEEDNELWMRRISELNFSSIYWQKYMYLKCVGRAVKKYSITEVVPVFPDDTSRWIYLIEFDCSVSFSRDVRTAIHMLVQRLVFISKICYLFTRNFIYEFTGVILAKILFNENISRDYDRAYFCNFPSNWSTNENLKYRFFNIINERKVRDNWLLIVSALHSNSDKISNPVNVIKLWLRFRSVENVVVLQRYSSLRAILESYLDAFKVTVNPSIKKTKDVFGFSDLFLRGDALIDFSKQRSLQSAAQKCFSGRLGAGSLVVPVYELVEGRVICSVARNMGVTVFGQQHSSSGRWGCLRSIVAVAALNSSPSLPVPSICLVEGRRFKDLHEGLGLSRVSVVGASRVKVLPRRQEPPSVGDETVVLIMLELHKWNMLAKFAIDLSSLHDTISVVVRPHPRSAVKVRGYYEGLADLPMNLQIDSTNDLTTCLQTHSPAIILAGETGSASELAFTGIPIFILDDGFLPNLSPITSHLSARYTLHSPAALVELATADDFQINHNKLSSDLYAQASQLIECVGFDADARVEAEITGLQGSRCAV